MTPTYPSSPGVKREGWKAYLIAGLWALLLLIAGWIATDATTARNSMAAQIKSEGDQIANDQQRIAVLEEANRNVRESLQRIESATTEIERELRERRGKDQ